MMRSIFKHVLLFSTLFFLVNNCDAQPRVDTILHVGDYGIHFNIIKGNGIPILFEAGAGNDGSIWEDLLQPIAGITQATLITYDRVGLGKSSADTNWRSIADGVKLLETALKRLGYDGELMFIAHSRGALYATTYANRNPKKVKMAVLIDGSSACSCTLHLTTVKGPDTLLKTMTFPVSVPVFALVSENTPFADQPNRDNWRNCHEKFVAAASNRIGIVAYGCGHYVFKDNPTLAINVIAEAYSRIVPQNRAIEINKRGLLYAIEGANQLKKKETNYQHSEDDLNNWGYALVGEGKMEEALKVFQLNVVLNPSSWNAYDSYGEALLKNGQKQEAIKMYQKSVELNPDNKGGKEILTKIAN